MKPLTATCVLKSNTTTLRTKRTFVRGTKTASGPKDIAYAMKKVMGVEHSKWREAVTAQMINAKANVGVQVKEISSHANEVQLDFTASMRFSTPNYYKTVPGCGDSGYADSSVMFVCVYWGGLIFVGTVPVWFLTLVSSRHSLEVRFIHHDISEVSTRNGMFHLSCKGLAVQP